MSATEEKTVDTAQEKTIDIFGATLSRKKFVQGSGCLIVALGVPATFAATAGAVPGHTVDPSKLASWIEILADNTVVVRTGQGEMGQGSATGAYAQIVAEELNLPYEAIKQVIVGSTDQTPDGGLSAGFLMKRPGQTQPEIFGGGALNLQRAAAYTYQALLSLASTQLGVPVGSLSAKNGVISGGGKTVTYGQLVSSGQFKLTIPTTGNAVNTPPALSDLTVTGNPPVKPPSQYSVVGTSQPMKAIPGIVTGKTPYVADIHVPGMLHARIVRPPTLGSTLVSVGRIDKRAYPSAQVVVKGNLVGVLSPQEWEAIGAAAQVAAATKWTAWQGLPSSGNTMKTLRSADYSAAPTTVGSRHPLTGANNAYGNVDAGFAGAAKVVSASYFKPYTKHGPIGPSITLADAARSDGVVHVWTAGQAMQNVRAYVALVLGIPVDNVVVHWTQGAGSYGRQHGAEHSELDAVILSQAVGKPVRVTWMRPEDFQWSPTSAAFLMDGKIGLDANGNMTALQVHYYAQQSADDRRPPGALLAGMPAGPAPALSNGLSNEVPYDKVPNLNEQGHSTPPWGQSTSPLNMGIRGHNMRTPNHREQNWALEAVISEAAAAAGVDPIDYRIRHTTNQRLITALQRLKTEHGWQTRPSPSPKARASGTGVVSGQGVGVMLRFNTIWTAAMNVDVDLKTGKVRVTKYTVVVEPGLAVNPRQLTLLTEGGMVMGISETLNEEMTFDKSKITSTDWVTYPIMRMAEMPDTSQTKVVVLDRRDLNVAGMGGEAPNALPPIAITGAFFDATGKQARSLPLRPSRVREILKA
jgi:CO/xanthine dehydrogenase Mo-binding subunit